MSGVRVRGLRIDGPSGAIVSGLDLDVAPGECVAIVGESGTGKSVSARALLGLTPTNLRCTADELEIDGVDARGFGERQWRGLRGRRIALVSQDALVSLDPLRRIGAEVAEPVRIHEPAVRGAALATRVRDSLERVAMPEPDERARHYPHELSGGLRQRALIASALAAHPAVLVADEPTTALDATVQARVLGLLRRIADDGVAVVFISHDLGAVAGSPIASSSCTRDASSRPVRRPRCWHPLAIRTRERSWRRSRTSRSAGPRAPTSPW